MSMNLYFYTNEDSAIGKIIGLAIGIPVATVLLVLSIFLIVYFWRKQKQNKADSKLDYTNINHSLSASTNQDLGYSNTYKDMSDDHAYQDLPCVTNYQDISKLRTLDDQPYSDIYQDIPNTHVYQSLSSDKNETKI